MMLSDTVLMFFITFYVVFFLTTQLHYSSNILYLLALIRNILKVLYYQTELLMLWHFGI